MRNLIFTACLAIAAPAMALAAPPPTAIFTDPAPDAAHPARLASVQVQSHGALMNAVWSNSINAPVRAPSLRGRSPG